MRAWRRMPCVATRVVSRPATSVREFLLYIVVVCTSLTRGTVNSQPLKKEVRRAAAPTRSHVGPRARAQRLRRVAAPLHCTGRRACHATPQSCLARGRLGCLRSCASAIWCNTSVQRVADLPNPKMDMESILVPVLVPCTQGSDLGLGFE